MDDLLTGEENLQLTVDLHHLRAGESKRVVTSLLERFDLAESAQTMAATYSGSASWAVHGAACRVSVRASAASEAHLSPDRYAEGLLHLSQPLRAALPMST